MTVKTIIFCASVLLVQKISGQCLGSPYTTGLLGNPLVTDGIGLAYDSINGLGLGFGGNAPTAGGLAVTSSSPLAPTGVKVMSDKLTIEGPLAVGGQLPFMGSVAVDGVVTTGGQGEVSYSCGDGSIGVVSEGVGITPSLSVTSPIVKEFGLNLAGVAGCGRGITI